MILWKNTDESHIIYDHHRAKMNLTRSTHVSVREKERHHLSILFLYVKGRNIKQQKKKNHGERELKREKKSDEIGGKKNINEIVGCDIHGNEERIMHF